jgi:transcriptional regulator with XRE-family HTH domain
VSATKRAQLARFVALVALHKEEAGRRVARAREGIGLTQQEAAEAVGVDRRTIQRYEAGEIGRMGTVAKLADAFGLTVEQMLGDEDYIPANTPLSERLERLEIGIAELHDKLDLVLAAVTAVGEADGDEAVLQDERQERRERLLAADEEPLPEPEIGHRAGVASESEREAG